MVVDTSGLTVIVDIKNLMKLGDKMTKEQIIKNYQVLYSIKGMEEIADNVIKAIGIAYDEGYKEGLRKAIEIQNEVSKLFDKAS